MKARVTVFPAGDVLAITHCFSCGVTAAISQNRMLGVRSFVLII